MSWADARICNLATGLPPPHVVDGDAPALQLDVAIAPRAVAEPISQPWMQSQRRHRNRQRQRVAEFGPTPDASKRSNPPQPPHCPHPARRLHFVTVTFNRHLPRSCDRSVEPARKLVASRHLTIGRSGHTRDISRPGSTEFAYAYSRQRPTRISASRSGSLTISMWQVSISISVCTPPSAAMYSC